MRIAKKEGVYDYQITAERSKVEGFSANRAATPRIEIDAFESQLIPYIY